MTLNSKQLGYKRNEKAYAWQSKFKTTDEKRIEELEQQLQAEQQAHNALREKLKSLEWSNRGMCPCCKETKYHDKECWLNKAIKEVD